MTAMMTDEIIVTDGVDPYDRPCERQGVPCPNVAVRRVKWGPDPSVPKPMQDQCRNTSLLCLSCYDRVVKATASQNWLIACYACDRKGIDAFKVVVSSDGLT